MVFAHRFRLIECALLLSNQRKEVGVTDEARRQAGVEAGAAQENMYDRVHRLPKTVPCGYV